MKLSCFKILVVKIGFWGFLGTAWGSEAPSYELSSVGCGEVEHRLVQNSLVLQFQNLAVESLPGQNISAHCQVAAMVKVPYGKRFKPIQAFVDGEVATSQGGRASLHFDYRFEGRVCEKKEEFGPRTTLKTFVSQSPRAVKWPYSECSRGNTFVPVDGDFRLMAYSLSGDPDSTSLALFNSEAQFFARWEWDFVDCVSERWNERIFKSRYTSPRGQWITGQTSFHFDGGEYSTDSGFRGTFHDVSYLENGRIAQGIWVFENGARGWFRFELLPDEKEFSGVWGEGEEIGQNQKGLWKGYTL